MSRYRQRFMDPDGRRHGATPTFPWRCAPEGMVTRRQLRRLGLRPAGQQPCGQVLWARGRGRRPGQASLYRVDLARPVRPMDAARRRTHQAMMRARRTCRSCAVVLSYDLSRKFSRTYLDCLEAAGWPYEAPDFRCGAGGAAEPGRLLRARLHVRQCAPGGHRCAARLGPARRARVGCAKCRRRHWRLRKSWGAGRAQAKARLDRIGGRIGQGQGAK